MLRGTPYLLRLQTGLSKPKRTIRGVDMAGRVEAVGMNVTQFQPGDEVFGEAAGAFAEYVSAPEGGLAAKPSNMTFEQVAAVPVAALTALQALRDKGRVQPGHKVLVNGASGGVGTFAVQIARSFGAEVTGVCSTRNLEMVRSIGAAHVIDYTKEDFTRGGQRYDVMLDMVGSASLSDCRRALNPEGVYVLVGAEDMGDWIGPVAHLARVLVSSWSGSQSMVPMLAKVRQEDLDVLKELMEAGEVTPVIDRRYELHEVPDAIRYVEAGHTRGKVVITV